ncbi:hypothetical protein DYB34_005410 [Aphanomyces astaci]|uniref:Probable pectate lyase F n=1 Tax=Aphanomyces astaci TaxID=112090 RepID=A0A418BRP7_APHAT|nr:hypothetical protein DYB34_005410 [Aphanomyces astaci]
MEHLRKIEAGKQTNSRMLRTFQERHRNGIEKDVVSSTSETTINPPRDIYSILLQEHHSPKQASSTTPTNRRPVAPPVIVVPLTLRREKLHEDMARLLVRPSQLTGNAIVAPAPSPPKGRHSPSKPQHKSSIDPGLQTQLIREQSEEANALHQASDDVAATLAMAQDLIPLSFLLERNMKALCQSKAGAIIQSAFHTFLLHFYADAWQHWKAFVVMSRHAERVAAASFLTRVYRGHRARKACAVLRRQLAALEGLKATAIAQIVTRRSNAALAIQMCFRRHRLHLRKLQVQARHAAATRIQRLTVYNKQRAMALARMLLDARKIHAALKLQKLWRGHCGRRVAARRKVQDRRAKRLQKLSQPDLAIAHRFEAQGAAFRIQGQVRRWLRRRRGRESRAAAREALVKERVRLLLVRFILRFKRRRRHRQLEADRAVRTKAARLIQRCILQWIQLRKWKLMRMARRKRERQARLALKAKQMNRSQDKVKLPFRAASTAWKLVTRTLRGDKKSPKDVAAVCIQRAWRCAKKRHQVYLKTLYAKLDKAADKRQQMHRHVTRIQKTLRFCDVALQRCMKLRMDFLAIQSLEGNMGDLVEQRRFHRSDTSFPIFQILFADYSGLKRELWAGQSAKALAALRLDRSKFVKIFREAFATSDRLMDITSEADRVLAKLKAHPSQSRTSLAFADFVFGIKEMAKLQIKSKKPMDDDDDMKVLQLFWKHLATCKWSKKSKEHASALCRKNHPKLVAYQSIPCVFRKYIDATSGLPYWTNPRTGYSTWKKPSILGKHDVDSPAVPMADDATEYAVHCDNCNPRPFESAPVENERKRLDMIKTNDLFAEEKRIQDAKAFEALQIKCAVRIQRGWRRKREKQFVYRVKGVFGKAEVLEMDSPTQAILRRLNVYLRHKIEARARALHVALDEYVHLGVPLPGVASIAESIGETFIRLSAPYGHMSVDKSVLYSVEFSHDHPTKLKHAASSHAVKVRDLKESKAVTASLRKIGNATQSMALRFDEDSFLGRALNRTAQHIQRSLQRQKFNQSKREREVSLLSVQRSFRDRQMYSLRREQSQRWDESSTQRPASIRHVGSTHSAMPGTSNEAPTHLDMAVPSNGSASMVNTASVNQPPEEGGGDEGLSAKVDSRTARVVRIYSESLAPMVSALEATATTQVPVDVDLTISTSQGQSAIEVPAPKTVESPSSYEIELSPSDTATSFVEHNADVLPYDMPTTNVQLDTTGYNPATTEYDKEVSTPALDNSAPADYYPQQSYTSPAEGTQLPDDVSYSYDQPTYDAQAYTDQPTHDPQGSSQDWQQHVALPQQPTQDDYQLGYDEYYYDQQNYDQQGYYYQPEVDHSYYTQDSTAYVEGAYIAPTYPSYSPTASVHTSYTEPVAATETEWQEAYDPSSGQVYYYNPRTGESVWHQ